MDQRVKHGKYVGAAAAARATGLYLSTLQRRIKRLGLTLAEAIAYRRPVKERPLPKPRSGGKPRLVAGSLVGLRSVAEQVGVSKQRVSQVMHKYNLDLAGALAFLQAAAEDRQKGVLPKKRPDRCSLCRAEGHRKTTCPERAPFRDKARQRLGNVDNALANA